MSKVRFLAFLVICGGLAGLAGCMDITGRGPAPLAQTVRPERSQRSSARRTCVLHARMAGNLLDGHG